MKAKSGNLVTKQVGWVQKHSPYSKLKENYMTAKIQFLSDPARANVGEILPDTYLVYREGYSLPKLSGVEYLEFRKFKNIYFNLHTNKIIFVGINRMINPANRCEMVFDYMQSMTRNIEKMSIDTEPFIGEPWRLWYHMDMTNSDLFKIPHSYAIETEWQHWFYRDLNDSRLSGKQIGKYLPNIYSDVPQLTTSFTFDKTLEDSDWYAEAKAHIFEQYGTPKLLVNNLLKLCNSHYNLNLSYDSFKSNKNWVLPDNKLYRFVVEECLRRKHTYNAVIGGKANGD